MLIKYYHKTEKCQGTNVLFCKIQEAEMGKIISRIFREGMHLKTGRPEATTVSSWDRAQAGSM